MHFFTIVCYYCFLAFSPCPRVTNVRTKLFFSYSFNFCSSVACFESFQQFFFLIIFLTHTHTGTGIHICCACVCVCVCLSLSNSRIIKVYFCQKSICIFFSFYISYFCILYSIRCSQFNFLYVF